MCVQNQTQLLLLLLLLWRRQLQQQKKMKKATAKCATGTKRSLSRRVRASSTRWHSRRTAGFGSQSPLLHINRLLSLTGAINTAEGLPGAGKGRRGVQRDAQPDEHRQQQQQVLHCAGLCPRLKAHLSPLVSLGTRFVIPTSLSFFLLMTMVTAQLGQGDNQA